VTPDLRLGIPAYGYPGTGVWESFRALPAGCLVVMDPADGPGVSIDPRYRAAVTAAIRQGLRVFGYVTADDGRRGAAAMEEEIECDREWYGCTGVFLDQVPPSSCSSADIVATASVARRRALALAINPGQPDIDPQDAELADHVVNFEGTHSTYRATRFPSWTQTLTSDKLWHLIYEVADLRAMREVAGAARNSNAGIVYITDATMPNPWERVPAYWAEEQGLVVGSNGHLGERRACP
jgi:hypothetical protein